jgi:hypothetical protein
MHYANINLLVFWYGTTWELTFCNVIRTMQTSLASSLPYTYKASAHVCWIIN